MMPYQFVKNDLIINRIMQPIKDFESSLDNNHDMIIYFGSFGPMTIETIDFTNSDFICFHGYSKGEKAQIIQHISQVNFMLLSAPRSEPNKPKKPIGFNLSTENYKS